MKYVCVKQCYWEECFWHLGDVVERPNDVKVPEHFQPHTPAVVESVTPKVAEEELPPSDNSAGSRLRETVKGLCMKHGIVTKNSSTIKWMREQLADKGVVVN